MREQLNCPNCGAPITSERCEYCGSMFYDFSAIEIDKPCYLKIKYDNNIIMVRAICKAASIEVTRDTSDVFDALGSKLLSFITQTNMDLSMSFSCVPFDNNNLMEVRTL